MSLSSINSTDSPAVTIIGIGNTLYTDEGIGIHVLPLLREAFRDDPEVEIVEGSTDGIRLLGPVEDASHLIILDAVNAGGVPGTLYTLEDEAIPAYCGAKMSVHQLGFQEVLFAARIRERLPAHMVLFGVQPGSLEFGIGLSPVGEAALPALAQKVCRQVQEWRCGRGSETVHDGAGNGAI